MLKVHIPHMRKVLSGDANCTGDGCCQFKSLSILSSRDGSLNIQMDQVTEG